MKNSPLFWLGSVLLVLVFAINTFFVVDQRKSALIFQLGEIQGADLAWGLGMQVFWTVFFIVLCRVTFHLGVRRYSGYGG